MSIRNWWQKRQLAKHNRTRAEALYIALVSQARNPKFFVDYGVNDNVDGRFDMIILHVSLVIVRLRALARDAEASGDMQLASEIGGLNQALYDVMFADMDNALREIGIGDMSIGKEIRKMSEAFQGRLQTYASALEAPDDEQLTEALHRNLYRGVDIPPSSLQAVGQYTRALANMLEKQPFAAFCDGQIPFNQLDLK